MKILHLYGDYRWTGPAEPVVSLCLALRKLGHTVHFACRRTPRRVKQSIEREAVERGLVPITDFHLNRYFNVLGNLQDIRAIRRFCEREEIDVVHAHLTHDHLLAGVAGRRARNAPRLVRTNHKGIPLRPSRGNLWLAKHFTDGLSGFSRKGMNEDARTFGMAADRTAVLPLAIDLDRFDPSRVRPGFRASLGIPENAPVGGIIARMQRHRRFDVLLKAIALAAHELPDLHFLVIGRGTHRQKVAIGPARALGLADRVHFTGYLKDRYLDAVGAIDFKVFLVPGSDGTCRAVREVMAMGKPILASRRGMLPELIQDGVTGLLVDDEPEAIANGIVALARDRRRCASLGAGARRFAGRNFSLTRQAESCAAWYDRVRALPAMSPGPAWIASTR